MYDEVFHLFEYCISATNVYLHINSLEILLMLLSNEFIVVLT